MKTETKGLDKWQNWRAWWIYCTSFCIFPWEYCLDEVSWKTWR